MTGKTLSDLTPAECLVLLDPKKSEGKEMVKVTLLDLLAKRFLVSEEREEPTLFLKKTVRRVCIKRGIVPPSSPSHCWILSRGP